MSINLRKLSAKFSEQDIEWRVQQSGAGKNGPWALIIPYITNRAIQQRLDDVCGAGNWENKYMPSPCGKGYLCGISILVGDRWVTRWDGAELTGNGSIDPVKSTLSNSMKRAGVQWGIGRYLYQFEASFADCAYCDNRYDTLDGYTYQFVKNKKSGGSDFGMQWKPKALPDWALPTNPQKVKEFITGMEIAETLDQLKEAFKYAYNHAISEQDDEMLEKFIKFKDESILRIEEEEEERKRVLSKKAEDFARDSIKVINLCNNESSVNSQHRLAISKVDQILDKEIQRKAILAIDKAAKEKLAALEEQNHENN